MPFIIGSFFLAESSKIQLKQEERYVVNALTDEE